MSSRREAINLVLPAGLRLPEKIESQSDLDAVYAVFQLATHSYIAERLPFGEWVKVEDFKWFTSKYDLRWLDEADIREIEEITGESCKNKIPFRVLANFTKDLLARSKP